MFSWRIMSVSICISVTLHSSTQAGMFPVDRHNKAKLPLQSIVLVLYYSRVNNPHINLYFVLSIVPTKGMEKCVLKQMSECLTVPPHPHTSNVFITKTFRGQNHTVDFYFIYSYIDRLILAYFKQLKN